MYGIGLKPLTDKLAESVVPYRKPISGFREITEEEVGALARARPLLDHALAKAGPCSQPILEIFRFDRFV